MNSAHSTIVSSSEPDVDLAACADEPIRIPGSIQPRGFLLALDDDLRIVQASANAAAVCGGRQPQGLVVDEYFPDELGREIRRKVRSQAASERPRQLLTVELGGRRFFLLAHRYAGKLILEFEQAATEDRSLDQLYTISTEFVASLQNAADMQALQDMAVREVRRLTGFDRVLLYQFDEQWHGTVTAEDRNERLPQYLGLRFPADDVPAQARELYRLNRVRLIADADYRPIPLEPTSDPRTGAPLDLTFAVLRSVSPVHAQYMRNMGTAASMSISVVIRGRLWGLVACHHVKPHHVPFVVRTACDLIGQVLALQIEARQRAEEAERRVRLKSLQSNLLAAMAAEGTDYAAGLTANPEAFLALAQATGGAVVDEARCRAVGRTPDERHIRRLAAWLSADAAREIFTTDALSELLPEFAELTDCAAGLAAVSVSKLHPSYVLWFRGEQASTVSWAGDPRKPPHEPGRETLHPRRSFELWKETVRGKSSPFSDAEVEALGELRNSIIGIVLRRAEETAELTAELQRSNKELEAFSYSVSHDLRAPFRHIVGFSELLRERASERLNAEDRRYLEVIAESAQTAGLLVDNLLTYSRMGRARLEKHPVDFTRLFAEARDEVMLDVKDRCVRWQIDPLPTIAVDPSMLRSVASNLLSNAVKFTRSKDEAVVTVSCRETAEEYVFSVRDNGAGFDMAYVDKLFGVFQRMHRMEDFEGTGIGLANVRRIIGRHGGRTWAEGEVGRGAEIFFTLPK